MRKWIVTYLKAWQHDCRSVVAPTGRYFPGHLATRWVKGWPHTLSLLYHRCSADGSRPYSAPGRLWSAHADFVPRDSEWCCSGPLRADHSGTIEAWRPDMTGPRCSSAPSFHQCGSFYAHYHWYGDHPLEQLRQTKANDTVKQIQHYFKVEKAGVWRWCQVMHPTITYISHPSDLHPVPSRSWAPRPRSRIDRCRTIWVLTLAATPSYRPSGSDRPGCPRFCSSWSAGKPTGRTGKTPRCPCTIWSSRAFPPPRTVRRGSRSDIHGVDGCRSPENWVPFADRSAHSDIRAGPIRLGIYMEVFVRFSA